MRAEATRAGGRHMLRERDGVDQRSTVDPEVEGQVLIQGQRGPMIERLDGASLMSIAEWMGVTVENLLGRYVKA